MSVGYESVFVAVIVFLSCLFTSSLWSCSIYPSIYFQHHYVQSECQIIEFKEISERDCERGICSPIECDPLWPSCRNLVNQPLNHSYCCGDSTCGQWCYDTCKKTKCKTHSETGQYHCEEKSYACDPRCCKSIRHQTCAFTCGTYYTFTLKYAREIDDGPCAIYTQDFECEKLDDEVCVKKFQERFSFITEEKKEKFVPCWYDTNSLENSSPPLLEPIPENSIGLWIFFIFCVLFVGFEFLYIGYICCYNNEW